MARRRRSRARNNVLVQQTLLDYYVGDLDPDTVTLE
jgi:hypothetical protein